MARQQLPDGFWVDVDEATGQMTPIDPDTGQPTGGPMSAFDVTKHLAAAAIGAIPRSTSPAAPVSPHPLPGTGGGAVTPPGNPPTQTAPTTAPTTTTAPAGGTPMDAKVQAWAQDHGGVVGDPSPVRIKINPQTGAYIDQKEKAHPWQAYMFADGSRLTINDLGETESELGWTVDKRAANKAMTDFQTQYGQQVGQPSINLKLSPNGTADPNPYYDYTFKNQNGVVTTVSMKASGEIQDLKPGTQQGQGQPVAHTTTAADGTKTTTYYERDPNGGWRPATGLPPEVTKGDKAWQGLNWTEVKGNKVLYGFDPADNQYKPVPGAPSVPTEPGQVIYQTTYDAQGHEVKTPMQYDPAAGGFAPAKGLQATVSPTGAPSAASVWTPVYRTPGDPTSGQIGFQDPSSKEFHPVAEKTPLTWDDAHGQRWAWDGVMGHEPKPLGQPSKTVTPFTGAGADVQNLTYTDEKGNIIQRPNANFVPKTLADVEARRGQLQTIMAAKSAEVQGNVGKIINGKIYTSDDALRDYNTWHAQQIEPQIQPLLAAQQAAQFEQAKDLATMRVNAQTAATQAGKNAIDAANAYREMHPVGPGYAAALNEVASKSKYLPKNFGDVVTYDAPNPIDLQKQQAAEALKYIDPTIASANGLPAPNLQGMSPDALRAALGANRYAPQSVGAPAAAPVAAAPAQADPNAWFTALQQRQAQDVADQRVQAQVPMPQPVVAPDNNASRQWAAAGIQTPDWLTGNAPPPPPPDQSPPGWGGIPQTLLQQYGTANPWDIYAPNYAIGG